MTKIRIIKTSNRVPLVAQRVKNPTSSHEDAGLIPGLAQWVKDIGVAVSCGGGDRCGLGLALLSLWHMLAVITPI